MSQHIDPTPKQTSVDALNDSMTTALNSIANLNKLISGKCKIVGNANKRYLKITLESGFRYGSLLVLCGGNIATYNFNGTASKVSGIYDISQNGNVFTVDFQSQYAHWGAIGFGSVADGTWTAE